MFVYVLFGTRQTGSLGRSEEYIGVFKSVELAKAEMRELSSFSSFLHYRIETVEL